MSKRFLKVLSIWMLASITHAAGPVIHSGLTDTSASRELHLPGYSAATTTALAAITGMHTADLAYTVSTDIYSYWNGSLWKPFSAGTILASSVSFNNSGTDYTAINVQTALAEADNWLKGSVVFPSPISLISNSAILVGSGSKLSLGTSAGANFSLLDTDGYGLKDVSSTISLLSASAPMTFGVAGGEQLLFDSSDNINLSAPTADIALNAANNITLDASGSNLTMDTSGNLLGTASGAISFTDSSSAQLTLDGTNSLSLITPFEGFSAADTGAYGTARMFSAGASIVLDDTNGGVASTDFSGSNFSLDGLGGSTWFTQSGQGFQFYGDGFGNLDEMTFLDNNGNNFDFNSTAMFIYNTGAGHGLVMDFGGQTSLHMPGDGSVTLSAPVTGSADVHAGGTTQIMSSGLYRLTTVGGLKYELNDSDDAYEFNAADASTVVDVDNMLVQSVKDPLSAQDAATKNYVDTNAMLTGTVSMASGAATVTGLTGVTASSIPLAIMQIGGTQLGFLQTSCGTGSVTITSTIGTDNGTIFYHVKK